MEKDLEKIHNKSESNIEKIKSDLKTMLNKWINSIWFIIALGIFILGKTIFFYQNTIAQSELLPFETIIASSSFIVVIICFLCILPNRLRGILGIVIDFLISILLFADNCYYTYSNSVLSIAQITNLQYGEEILGTLPMIIELKQILYFLDIIILAILLITKVIKINKKERKTKKQLAIKWTAGIIGVVFFCMMGLDYVEKGQDKSYNKDMQIRESSIFGYHIYDLQSAINIKSQAKYQRYDDMIKDYQDLKEEYQEKYGRENYDFKGIIQDKNIIMIQLESVQEFVLHKEINGKPITPNLNKFLSENIEISNMHMQSYSTTADSEHSAITSIYPMENGMSFSRYYTNTYDDIFKLYNDAGYETSYMHGNDAYFWNRGNVYSRMGVKNIALKDKFQETEYINGFLSDETVYNQAVEKLTNLGEPFLSFIVAASSHTPYELEGLQDRSKVSIDVGKYKGTYFGNYLEAVNYADYAFGVFIDGLKEVGLYDDTVILVFGDHNGLNMYNDEMIEFLRATNPNLNDTEIRLNYTRVAAGIKIPGIKNIKIEKPTSKLDIKPTLTYLSGIEDGFSLGTNMFDSKEFVSLNNGRIIGSRYYYDENWYEIATGNVVELEGLEPEIKEVLDRYYEEMKRELEISNSVSINNLLDKRRQ